MSRFSILEPRGSNSVSKFDGRALSPNHSAMFCVQNWYLIAASAVQRILTIPSVRYEICVGRLSAFCLSDFNVSSCASDACETTSMTQFTGRFNSLIALSAT